jgi:hypothetical protein
MDNTPNNNNQLIRSKPKISYTWYLVEDDKNHEVSIFHVREGPPECDGKRDISAVGHF